MAAMLLAMPAAASAADQVVTDLGDTGPGTLRQAIADAGNGDEITFDVTGTIQLESELTIDEDLAITGPGADDLVISGALGFRVFNVGSGSSTIADLTVANGHPRTTGAADVEEFGGGITNSGSLTLDRVVVRDNTADAAATGIGYEAEAGGGGVANFGTLSVHASTLTGNRVIATGDGGLSIDTRGRGGAVLNESGSLLFIEGSTISDNRVEAESAGPPGSDQFAFGGGIDTLGGGRIVRSTIVGNSVRALPQDPQESVAGGGGLGGDNPDVEDVTIARNRGLEGANVDVSPQAQFANSIVADAVGPGVNCRNQGGPSVSHGYNLDDDSSCAFNQPTDQEIDPLLAPALGEHGGPTQTLALLPGSPAIDQGLASSDTIDQRGLPRPSDFTEIVNAPGGDGSDVGAFELQVPVPVPEPPAAPPVTHPECRGLEATIVGTDAGETITGTDEVDVIVAGAGDDRVRSLTGNDVVCGGAGRDRISGGSGFDKLQGEAGNDRLNGGTGRDKLFGQAGKDRLKGAGGRDTCRGGGSSDVAVACEVERTI